MPREGSILRESPSRDVDLVFPYRLSRVILAVPASLCCHFTFLRLLGGNPSQCSLQDDQSISRFMKIVFLRKRARNMRIDSPPRALGAILIVRKKLISKAAVSEEIIMYTVRCTLHMLN